MRQASSDSDPRLDVPQIPAPPDVAQPPADAVRTPRSMLASKVLRPGTGQIHPRSTDLVTVHYTAWTLDGTTVDDSRSRRTPTVWTPNHLMEGLTVGILLMVVGETRRLWIPQSMAHEWASGPMVFDVELLAIAEAPASPTRNDILTPPADAARRSSGLSVKVLRSGTGSERPKPMSTVTIHYTAWTTYGTVMFDDSVARDTPLTVAVDTLVPGLSEGLQSMVVGQKSRFWIPAALAYTPPGPPRSDLVFDVELLAIQRAIDGAFGTIRVQTNSPDAGYLLILPDGTPLTAKGPKTFARTVPGRYRVKAATMKSYALGIVSSPADMALAPGGTLDITIIYTPIVQ